MKATREGMTAMIRNYWLYQARGEPEPWAAHIVASNVGRKFRISIDFYAEYLDNAPDYSEGVDMDEPTRNDFIAAFASFSASYEKLFALDDLRQVTLQYNQIASDFNLKLER